MVGGDADAHEDLLGPRLQRVAVLAGDELVELHDAIYVGILAVRDLVQLAQRRVHLGISAHRHIDDSLIVFGELILAQDPQTDALAKGDVAIVHRFVPCEHAQEGGLSAAVRSHEPVALSRIQLQSHSGKEQLRAEALADILDVDHGAGGVAGRGAGFKPARGGLPLPVKADEAASSDGAGRQVCASARKNDFLRVLGSPRAMAVIARGERYRLRMLTFSTDGPTAEKQMRAVIFYLTTFGYIDGDFDDNERDFVREYIRKLVAHRVKSAVGDADLQSELSGKYSNHFLEVFEGIDRQVKDLFTEAVAEGEEQDTFVHAKLKLRCFEIFKSFDEANQEQLMASIDELINADGVVHPAEAKFRAELADLLNADLGVELIDDAGERPLEVGEARTLETTSEDHPFFEQFEQHYSSDRGALVRQVDSDRKLMDRVMAIWEQQRVLGRNKLADKKSVNEFSSGSEFLDGHTYLLSPEPGQKYELTIVGDLHGCYSCLKGVLHQTDFFRKVAEYEKNPRSAVCPKLVLLGDYIDRGMFSYQGVLRSVLQVFAKAPDHVYLLRGNHEYYIEHQGRVYGAVRPSEAMDTLKPHLSEDVFQHYVRLFEAMPNTLLFEKFMFVHGGIPKDLTLKNQYQGLSSLNDWDIRFQMMWSDPSSADVIPAALQDQSARFPFGKLQCQAFLQRLGCHTLFRGHEKVEEGFRESYGNEAISLFTVFSSGGAENNDLPPDSSYRSVTPMAVTLRYKDGRSEVLPFLIDYKSFNDPARNKFYQSTPETLTAG